MQTPSKDWLGAGADTERTWLVTGAAGFIGSHCVEVLLSLGQRVIGLDNFATGKRSNIEALQTLAGPAAWQRFSFVEADVRDLDACLAAFEGVDFVLHQAAIGSVPRSIADPVTTHTVNVSGSLNVFYAAVQRGVRRVVYASSSSVYGDIGERPNVESRVGNPLSPYAASKRMSEIYAGVFARTHGLEAVGLRYFNVVGPRQDPNGTYAAAIPKWLELLRAGQRPVIFGDGETSRDFCPVQNVVQANLLAASAGAPLAGRVYNVALGGNTSLNQLFVLLRDAMAARGVPCGELQPSYEAFRPGDVRHSQADISAARADLGFVPSMDLAAGLQRTVDAVVAG